MSVAVHVHGGSGGEGCDCRCSSRVRGGAEWPRSATGSVLDVHERRERPHPEALHLCPQYSHFLRLLLRHLHEPTPLHDVRVARRRLVGAVTVSCNTPEGAGLQEAGLQGGGGGAAGGRWGKATWGGATRGVSA